VRPEIPRREVAAAIRGLVLLALPMLMGACATLPVDPPRAPSMALADTGATRLGRGITRQAASHADRSGIHALTDGREAFAARILLIQAADRSVDLQYYIWRDDTTGRLLMEAAWQAAERGVRVRMLLDDANARKLDATVADLDSHPNIEVRLFNPFANRSFAMFEAIGDFGRINRRMHNKALIADNRAAIVGGRNVGDEYFGAGTGAGFADLDVAAIGPLVGEVSAEFDRYWNSPSAYPAAVMLGSAPPGSEARLRAAWTEARQEAEAQEYEKALRETPLVRHLLAGELSLDWCPARLLADDPAKVLGVPDDAPPDLLLRIQAALGAPQRELNLVSPYFVPGRNGVDAFARLAARGVQVRVLTNSLSATDVAPVHAGYSKYREDLLRAGVRLFELKRDAASLHPPKEKKEKGDGSYGSSGSSLHAKTFGVDRTRIFVGSFNLDPRSARLNTEMGAVIDSEALAARLSGAFDGAIPREAYEVRLAADGALEWVERANGAETVFTTEPHSGAMRRLWVQFLTLLPIEWLL